MDGTVKVWPMPADVPSPAAWPFVRGGVQAIAWSVEPGVLRAFDAEVGTVTDWDAGTGLQRGQAAVPSGSWGRFSRGGKLLVVAASGEREKTERLLLSDATPRPAGPGPSTQ